MRSRRFGVCGWRSRHRSPTTRRSTNRRSVDHYIEALGVDGISCGGVMGEFWSMTIDERRRVHEVVADATAGRIPSMTQTGSHVFSETVALADHAAEIGMDLAIVMNPFFPPNPSDDLVRAWYTALNEQTDIPTFLFIPPTRGTRSRRS